MKNLRKRAYEVGSRAESDELWQMGEVRRIHAEIVNSKHKKAVILTENGGIECCPQSWAGSIRPDCLAGVYDRHSTVEQILEDLKCL